MSEKKLYIFLAAACVLGYSWLFYSASSFGSHTVCFFKTITAIPCPSCGATRSALCLLHGEFIEAIRINPLGIVVASLLLVMPLWLIYDFSFRKNSAYRFYHKSEKFLKKKIVYMPLIALVAINWIWNITKEL